MAESTENTFADKPSAVELPDEVRRYKSSGLPRIFASGDMRLMKCINNGNNTVHPIHSQYEDMDGLNFLGNLTNIKQHIQFVKYITGKCAIPKKMLHLFLKAYEIDKYFNEMDIAEFDSPTKEAFFNLEFYFNKCEAYIFQITSMQIAEKDGFQVLSSIEDDDIKRYTQTEEDFVEDIKTLISLIPAGRKVIFMNDIYPELVVESAETIPELYTITALLRTATVNAEFNKHSVRFFDYNKLQTTPFFKQLFAENSTEFKPMGLGFSFIMLNEYFIKP